MLVGSVTREDVAHRVGAFPHLMVPLVAPDL